MHGILFFRPANSEPWASGYCAINVAPGSLVCQVKGDINLTRTLIPELRGCRVRTHYDSEAQNQYLSVTTAHNDLRYHLRPTVPETFESWLAALLCWQPLRPKSRPKHFVNAPTTNAAEKRRSLAKRFVDIAGQKKTSVVKIGKMLLWEGPIPPPLTRQGHVPPTSPRARRQTDSSWKRISCTLHENGDLKLLAETDSALISRLSLSRLSRIAIQQLHPSITFRNYCLAIYPQYLATDGSPESERIVVFAFETRQAADVWYALLRAFAMPEIYDCSPPSSRRHSSGAYLNQTAKEDGMFRIERSVSVRIVEARFKPSGENTLTLRRRTLQQGMLSEGSYAEVVIGDDLKARTVVRQGDGTVFWAEEFSFESLPSESAAMRILIKDGSFTEREWTTVTHGSYDLTRERSDLAQPGRIEVSAHDAVFGSVEVQFDELDKYRDLERRWPIIDKDGLPLGDLLMKVNLKESFVLMRDKYLALSDLILNVSNGLTIQIAQVIGNELKALSEVLLDIFQVSGTAYEWISYLIDEEIDGIYKDTQPTRLRFIGRVYSSDSLESGEDRELLVRDLSRSANNEANLLFRGNSLVTKALDIHMRRLGRDYLEDTLGPVLRDIVRRQLDCEVDPARLPSREQRDRNWTTLTDLIGWVWNSISSSAFNCPAGLRILFRHIRSCAEDRYGSFIRTVKYTSVSGFLFLRLFCPAILNPELFELLPGKCDSSSRRNNANKLTERPNERSRRTLTLIAKSLIVLANMAKFGAKEPWMEHMNRWLVTATPVFKAFIEDICSISSFPHLGSSLDPQNATPLQIMARLPEISQEGSLSLPYLLDQSKLYSNLIRLWIDNAPRDIEHQGAEECVNHFHRMAVDLHAKAKVCQRAAQSAEKPSQGHETQWAQLVLDQQNDDSGANPFEDNFVIPEDQVSDLSNRSEYSGSQKANGPTGDTSAAEDYTPPTSASGPRDSIKPTAEAEEGKETGTYTTNSTNSSTISFDTTNRKAYHSRMGSKDGKSHSRQNTSDLAHRPAPRR